MYPGDFDTDERVRRLDFEGIGFFVTLLNYAWVNDGLPADFGETSAQLLGEDRRRCRRLWKEVSSNFPMAADGRFRNPRQERERKKSVAVHDAAVKAAKARWNGHANAYANAYPIANADAMPTEQNRTDTTLEQASSSSYNRTRAEISANGAAAACLPDPEPEPEPEPPPGLSRFEGILWRASRDLILPSRTTENDCGRSEPNPVWDAFAGAMRNAQERILRANDPVAYARTVIQHQLKALGFVPKMAPQQAKKAAG